MVDIHDCPKCGGTHYGSRSLEECPINSPMTPKEKAELELDCAQGGLSAMLAYQRECVEKLERADKAVDEARKRLDAAEKAMMIYMEGK